MLERNPPPSTRKRGAKRKLTEGVCWPWLKRGVGTLLFVGVGYLLISQARSIEWARVLASLQQYPPTVIWGAVALTIASFNLNLGSMVGGVAFRLRLYSRLGLALGVITRVMSVSMPANWMGYLLLAGLVFGLQPPALPAHWKIDAIQLRLTGLLLLVIAGAYLAACAWSRQRTLRLRGNEIELPSLLESLDQPAGRCRSGQLRRHAGFIDDFGTLRLQGVPE